MAQVSTSIFIYVATVLSACIPGCLLLFLPPYSPDLNPIKESFSTREHSYFSTLTTLLICTGKVKAFMRHHGAEMRAAEDPVQSLLEACGCITSEMARGWFWHAGYT